METILIQYKLKWQFIDNNDYKVSICKKVINTKTSKIIKKTTSGRSVGYYISEKFYKLSNINDFIEIIPKSKLPF